MTQDRIHSTTSNAPAPGDAPRRRGSAWLLSLCALCLIAAGCAPRVINLRESQTLESRRSPLPLVAKIEEFEAPSDDFLDSTKHLEGGLAEALREANLFTAVIYPSSDWTEADVTFKGRVEQTWASSFGENFVTHFPGGLIFAPNWHGLRYPLTTQATIEVLDTRTGKVVSEYTGNSSHLFVHKSANPAHFLGAAAVLPAVIRGAVLGDPNGRRRQMTYDVAYQDLWVDVAQEIQAQDFPFEAGSRRPTASGTEVACPRDTTRLPTVGENWEHYRSCQASKFRLTGQVASPDGVASVFREDRAGGIVVHVVDGEIVRWERANAGAGPRRP